MFNLIFDPVKHTQVLVVIGESGSPAFNVIHQNESYLEKVGKEMINKKSSRFSLYMVLDSNTIFSDTRQGLEFNEALEMLIKNELFQYNNALATKFRS